MSVMNDRTSGYCGCGCGSTYRLGERDCGDYLVGYIDDGGLCWESLHERNQSVGAGELREHHRRGGPFPDWLLRLPREEFDAVVSEYAAQSRLSAFLRGQTDSLE
jgi:hypothetical protein